MRHTTVQLLYLIVGVCLNPISSQASNNFCQDSEIIYTNASFITLNPKMPQADAVAVHDGRITAIDNKKNLLDNCQGKNTQLIDLKGAVATPGLINTYSNFILYGWLKNHAIQASSINIYKDPGFKPVKSTEQFIEVIKKNLSTPKPILLIAGYDESRMQGTPLNQTTLNELSLKKPIVVFHATGNKALLNQAAIDLLFTKGNSAQVQVDYSGEVSGTSMNTLLEKLIAPKELKSALLTSVNKFAESGYTTASEAQGIKSWQTFIHEFASKNPLPIDLILLSSQINHQNPRVIQGPVVIEIDGLAQNFQAYLTKPYLKKYAPYGKAWQGSLLDSSSHLDKTIHQALKIRGPIIFKAHGDAAIDYVLERVRHIRGTKKYAFKKVIFMNNEYIRKDQLNELKQLGVHISWNAPYLYYWGESMCNERIGPQRALQINPYLSAEKHLDNLTAHESVLAAPPAPLDTMTYMATRIVQQFNYLSSSRCPQYFEISERVKPEKALKALTVEAAKLYHLEKEKGTISVGKLAEMTLLSAHPLNIKGKKVTVLGTITHGKLRWNQGPLS